MNQADLDFLLSMLQNTYPNSKFIAEPYVVFLETTPILYDPNIIYYGRIKQEVNQQEMGLQLPGWSSEVEFWANDMDKGAYSPDGKYLFTSWDNSTKAFFIGYRVLIVV